jgi:hypothetical protein
VTLADLPFTEIARNGVDRRQISRKLTSIFEVLLANVVGEWSEIVAHHRNRLMEEVNRVVNDPVLGPSSLTLSVWGDLCGR